MNILISLLISNLYLVLNHFIVPLLLCPQKSPLNTGVFSNLKIWMCPNSSCLLDHRWCFKKRKKNHKYIFNSYTDFKILSYTSFKYWCSTGFQVSLEDNPWNKDVTPWQERLWLFLWGNNIWGLPRTPQ